MPFCGVDDSNVVLGEGAFPQELMAERDTGGAIPDDHDLMIPGCCCYMLDCRNSSRDGPRPTRDGTCACTRGVHFVDVHGFCFRNASARKVWASSG